MSTGAHLIWLMIGDEINFLRYLKCIASYAHFRSKFVKYFAKTYIDGKKIRLFSSRVWN